ncbi:MAG: hypothetical protein QF903_07865 [Planctomycetota bacterium]|jgi:hypothetical protein|nr:hypothetical protein [Planctomycetota bacterium]MDP6989381.1 hypothetical protein [Planctomycetota bacterium]
MDRRCRELTWTIGESLQGNGPTPFDEGALRVERGRRFERALGRTLWLVLIGVLIWNSLT